MGGAGPAEGSTTRGTSAGAGRSATEPRVDAGVKELNEMTIGRTDDPENPFGAQAFQSRRSVWDWIADPIWASGHEPRQQAVHMIAVEPPVRILILPLASEGPSTHAPMPRFTIRQAGGSAMASGRRFWHQSETDDSCFFPIHPPRQAFRAKKVTTKLGRHRNSVL